VHGFFRILRCKGNHFFVIPARQAKT
jgi:hypothetical protein